MDSLDLDDLCAALGYTATRVIAAWFGGRYLHVPTAYAPDHPLHLLIGEPAVRKLVSEFPGDRLRIPDYREEGRYRRDRLIAEHLANGAGPEAIAGMFDLSPRRIEQLHGELIERGWLTYLDGSRRRAYRGRPHRDAPRAEMALKIF